MLLCCAGSTFLIMLDTNIVAVSLPSIARDLHGEFTDVEWVVSAYILPFAALLMPAGAVADRFGRRRTLLAGLSIFALASVFCGLAPNLAVLNSARALQAVGAALQLSSALAVIGHGFQVSERVKVYAIWGTVMGVAPSLGPILGGFVTSYLSWRWAFFINLPLGLILISLAIASIDESRDPKAGRFDIFGVVLFGATLFSVVWALIEANSVGWNSESTLSKLAIGAVSLVLFVLVERKHSRPMIDLTIFRSRLVVGATIAMFGYAAAVQVMMTLLPLYLQNAFHYSPAVAGLTMLPFALPLLIGPSIGAKLSTWMGMRELLAFGLVLAALGNVAAAATAFVGLGYWAAAIGMFIMGSGAGILNSETTKAQMTLVPPERAGMASGFAATTRFAGIITGIASLGAVLAGTAESTLHRLGAALVPEQAVDWHGLSLRVVGGDASGALSAFPVELRPAIEDVVHRSIANGFAAMLATAAIVAMSACVATWLLMSNVHSLVEGRAKRAADAPATE